MVVQTFEKVVCARGTEYPCSAEQLLSHLLPVIAGIKGKDVSVKVEPDSKIKT